MDSDVAMSVDRARRRNQTQASKDDRTKSDENRFEQESRAFFGRVRNAYLAIAAREPIADKVPAAVERYINAHHLYAG